MKYRTGDATQPIGDDPKIIAHVCNDIGGWGRGFVMALSNRWSEPERMYRRWYSERRSNDFGLGAVQLVSVDEELWVANMIGQRDVRRVDGVPPIRYDALAECLRSLADHAAERNASVHMPRIGAGLAGGDWKRIEGIILEQLAVSVPVTVYDQP